VRGLQSWGRGLGLGPSLWRRSQEEGEREGLIFLAVLPIRFLDMLISYAGWINLFLYVDGGTDGCCVYDSSFLPAMACLAYCPCRTFLRYTRFSCTYNYLYGVVAPYVNQYVVSIAALPELV
jgi:hypothetical protein